MKQPPFKVMAFGKGNYNRTRCKNIPPMLEVGSEYVVIGLHNGKYGLGYFLEGFPSHLAFNPNLFATLPSQDADAMQEETRESIVNIETSVV